MKMTTTKENTFKLKLRSTVTEEERMNAKNKQEEKLCLPPLKYKGKIKYIGEFIDIAMACDEISKLVDAAPEFLVLGFDMEWPFNIQTGSGKTAVIQISPNLETCYVLQVSKLRNLPKALSELLAHPKTRITGINIKNDIKKLSRDFTGFDTAKIINNCIDSGVLANTILPFQNRWSMEKLITYLLNVKIDKNKKVRMSKWHVSPLSEEQLKYAATDSYASLLLYLELKNREKQMDTNT